MLFLGSSGPRVESNEGRATAVVFMFARSYPMRSHIAQYGIAWLEVTESVVVLADSGSVLALVALFFYLALYSASSILYARQIPSNFAVFTLSAFFYVHRNKRNLRYLPEVQL